MDPIHEDIEELSLDTGQESIGPVNKVYETTRPSLAYKSTVYIKTEEDGHIDLNFDNSNFGKLSPSINKPCILFNLPINQKDNKIIKKSPTKKPNVKDTEAFFKRQQKHLLDQEKFQAELTQFYHDQELIGLQEKPNINKNSKLMMSNKKLDIASLSTPKKSRNDNILISSPHNDPKFLTENPVFFYEASPNFYIEIYTNDFTTCQKTQT